MRDFCRACNRPIRACFCAEARPFASSAEFALIVHPDEANSTVGTAWILRRSITNIHWIRSKGMDLDTDPKFQTLLETPSVVPLLLFPGEKSLNLNQASFEEWRSLVPSGRRPLFIVVDGTWTQAKAMLRMSTVLRALPKVSFDTAKLSEYGFKTQPHPHCLSCVEGVHRVMEVMASRGWDVLPAHREHDQMIEIFRQMVQFQLKQEKNPRYDIRVLRRALVSGRRS